jgi:hypothetical protein
VRIVLTGIHRPSTCESLTTILLSKLFLFQGHNEEVNVLGIVVCLDQTSFSIRDESRWDSPIVVEGVHPGLLVGDYVLLRGYTVCNGVDLRPLLSNHEKKGTYRAFKNSTGCSDMEQSVALNRLRRNLSLQRE